MKTKKLVLISAMILLLDFLGCSLFRRTKRQHEDFSNLVTGFDSMLESIDELERSPAALKEKNFLITVKQEGNWDLSVSPLKAFKVTKLGEKKFKTKIINLNELYDSKNGILKRKDIAIELIEVVKDQGQLEINSVRQCYYPITFYQVDGSKVNFAAIGRNYEVKFVISDKSEVELKALKNSTAYFSRKSDSKEEEFVQLKLVDKKTKEVFLTEKNFIPACLTKKEQEDIVDEIHLENPSQCIHETQLENSLQSNYQTDLEREIKIKNTYKNQCSRRVQCRYTYRVGLIKEGKIIKTFDFLAKINFSTLEEKIVNQKLRFNFDLEQLFDYKIYSLVKVSPYVNNEDYDKSETMLPYFICHFEKGD